MCYYNAFYISPINHSFTVILLVFHLDYMRDQLKRIADAFLKGNENIKHINENIFFLTIHDAVLCATAEVAKQR